MNDNMLPNELIEISFSGKDVKPDTVKASDIGDILKAIESMVESQVFQEHPEINREKVIIGFVNIRSSSVDLQFTSPFQAMVQSAFSNIGQAVRTNSYSELPSESVEGINTIITFTRKKQCVANFISVNGHRTILATITPQTTIAQPPMLTGETTIFGKVVRVGGREPRVMVEMVNGRTIYCEANVEVARKLGEKLYRIVGLLGTASWNAKTLVIEKFSITGITEYEDLSLVEAMNQLSKAVGKYYSEIDDVQKYISDIRGSGDQSK